MIVQTLLREFHQGHIPSKNWLKSVQSQKGFWRLARRRNPLVWNRNQTPEIKILN